MKPAAAKTAQPLPEDWNIDETLPDPAQLQVSHGDATWRITLDIVPDEDEPHALLAASMAAENPDSEKSYSVPSPFDARSLTVSSAAPFMVATIRLSDAASYAHASLPELNSGSLKPPMITVPSVFALRS